MSKRSIKGILFLCIFLMSLQSLSILASEGNSYSEGNSSTEESIYGERNIYIGDIVTLDIKVDHISKENVANAFSEFEIVDISELEGSYQIKIRSYEPGEKVVKIGNQEVTIIVASLLAEIDREDIYDGDLLPRDGEKSIYWLLLYGFVILIILITAGIYIYKYRHKKEKSRSPHQEFLYAMNRINVSEGSSLEEMTAIIKQYIETIYKYKFIGKSTNEMMNDLKDLVDNEACKTNLMNWLMTCDAYKFRGQDVNEDERIQLKEELLTIGENFYKIELDKRRLNDS